LINNRQNGRRRGRGGGSGAPRPNGSNGGQDRGNRIDNRARGNAAQLLEKYKALARDAQMQGDRVNTEYYLQFADHYFRVLSESRARFEEQQPRQRRDEYANQSDEEYGDEGERVGGEAAQAGPSDQGFSRRDNAPQRDYAQDEAGSGDGGSDDDRRPRRGRGPRNDRRFDAPASAPELPLPERAAAPAEPVAASEAEEAAPARRRGRPPKAKPAEQIDVDSLPPSLKTSASADAADEDAPKPRTRARKPRGETATA